MSNIRFVVEEVGFGGSIQQVSKYIDNGGTIIVKQYTGLGSYEANRAAAIALCNKLNAAVLELA